MAFSISNPENSFLVNLVILVDLAVLAYLVIHNTEGIVVIRKEASIAIGTVIMVVVVRTLPSY